MTETEVRDFSDNCSSVSFSRESADVQMSFNLSDEQVSRVEDVLISFGVISILDATTLTEFE